MPVQLGLCLTWLKPKLVFSRTGSFCNHGRCGIQMSLCVRKPTSAVRAWNNLSNEIRTSTSLNEFKRKLSENVNKPPKYYYYGNRVAQIHHSRLRLECSALKQHLHKKKLVDSPLCTCGIPETSKHFLFDCPNYQLIRTRTLSEYLHLPTKSLLFGDSRLSENENEKIFEAVHKFITQTGRF